MEKKCTKCETLQSTVEFRKSKRSKDNLESICKTCLKDKYRKNRESVLSRQKAYYEANRDFRIEDAKRRYWENRDYKLEYNRLNYIKNRPKMLKYFNIRYSEDKEFHREYQRSHYKNNKHIYIANARKREGRLNEGINKEFNDRMKEIYFTCEAISKEFGITYQVDHIIPLTHNNVCGLHVPWNIQLLTKDENQTKKNKFDGTYDNESWRSSS